MFLQMDDPLERINDSPTHSRQRKRVRADGAFSTEAFREASEDSLTAKSEKFLCLLS